MKQIKNKSDYEELNKSNFEERVLQVQTTIGYRDTLFGFHTQLEDYLTDDECLILIDRVLNDKVKYDFLREKLHQNIEIAEFAGYTGQPAYVGAGECEYSHFLRAYEVEYATLAGTFGMGTIVIPVQLFATELTEELAEEILSQPVSKLLIAIHEQHESDEAERKSLYESIGEIELSQEDINKIKGAM